MHFEQKEQKTLTYRDIFDKSGESESNMPMEASQYSKKSNDGKKDHKAD